MELIDAYRHYPNALAAAIGILVVVCAALVGTFGFGRRDLASREALYSSGASLGILAANVVVGVSIAAVTGLMISLYASIGLPTVAPQGWVGVPFWLAVLLALLVSDIKNYAAHRWLHARIGWPIHAIHHSDPHVNGLTAFRIHALEVIVMQGFHILLFGWLGTPPLVAVTASLVAQLYDFYVHTDSDIEHGRLRRIIASPRFHRWHHYDNPAAYTTNLAGIFSFLDVIFGTYREPARLPDPLGAATAGVPQNDVAKLLLFPFSEWARMARERLKRSAAA